MTKFMLNRFSRYATAMDYPANWAYIELCKKKIEKEAKDVVDVAEKYTDLFKMTKKQNGN